MDRFVQPGLGSNLAQRPPFQTAVDDPYESYEANILWDQEGASEDNSQSSSDDQRGLLADSASEASSSGEASDGGITLLSHMSCTPVCRRSCASRPV